MPLIWSLNLVRKLSNKGRDECKVLRYLPFIVASFLEFKMLFHSAGILRNIKFDIFFPPLLRHYFMLSCSLIIIALILILNISFLLHLIEVLGRTSWLSTPVTISHWKKSTTSNTRLTCHLCSWVTDSLGCSLLMCSSITTSFWEILVRASTLVSGIIVSSHPQRETILLVMSLSTSLIELKNGDLIQGKDQNMHRN